MSRRMLRAICWALGIFFATLILFSPITMLYMVVVYSIATWMYITDNDGLQKQLEDEDRERHRNEV